MLVTTKSGVVITILAGRPSGENWDEKMRYLGEEMTQAAEVMDLPEEMKHRRGDYRTVHTGVSYGGGSQVSLRNSLRFWGG